MQAVSRDSFELEVRAAIEQSIETFRDVCGPTFDPDEFRSLAERSVARSFRPEGTLRQLAAIIASPRIPSWPPSSTARILATSPSLARGARKARCGARRKRSTLCR